MEVIHLTEIPPAIFGSRKSWWQEANNVQLRGARVAWKLLDVRIGRAATAGTVFCSNFKLYRDLQHHAAAGIADLDVNL